MKTITQKLSRRPSLQCSFSFLLLLIILFVVQMQSFATTKGKRLTGLNKYDAILTIAEAKGSLPVIIRFKKPSSVTGKQSLSSTPQIKQERINMQTSLVSKLVKYKPQNIKHFKHIPFSAMHLSAEGIRAAMLDSDIVEIYEDTLSSPTLATSSPLIGATAAANLGYGGQGQTIAILDTGVDKAHPFLSGKVVSEACFSKNLSSQGATSLCPNGQSSQLGSGSGVPCSSSTSGCNHGTHVAGIAVGKGSSFSGVAKEANTMAIQVFSKFTDSAICGSAPSCVRAYSSDIMSALQYVYEQRENFSIASVNMSLGGGEFPAACDSDPRKSGIDLLRTVGIATVISSGNDGAHASMGAPGCISTAISVGSTTKQDSISSFSNSASFLDLLAPGSSINSSIPGGGYAYFDGTSMAAPQVAGAVAVLKSRLPTASVDQVESALKSTGVGLLDSRNGITKPRIQIDSALTAISPPTVPTLSISPADNLTMSGPAGGPFTPSGTVFALSNITSSTQALNYSISENANWLHLDSATSGQIPANASTSISTSIVSSAANALPIGQYPATLSFTNTTNSAGSTQITITLVVTGNNDYFVNAIPIAQSGESVGTTTGNNDSASYEGGEPDHAKRDKFHSVWWQWTAPANGDITLDTCGSDFDTLLGVYTGTVINALSETTSSDDSTSCNLQSEVSFFARAGVTYFIAVDGFNGYTGNIALNWNFSSSSIPSPSISIVPAIGATITGGSNGPFSPSIASYSVTNVGTANQNIILTTPPWLSASTGRFSLTPGDSVSVSFSISSLASTMPPGIYSGVVDFGHFARAVILNLTSGTLSNDNFQSAIDISGQTQVVWNNTLASKEVGEPNHAGRTGGKSVWWKWTAPKSGIVTIDTKGSTFDTVLAIYSGNSLAQLTALAANDDDDDDSSLLSKVTLSASPNVTYYIAVDGYNGKSGGLHLNITGDVDVEVIPKAVKNDFNGDGKADILWRHATTGQNYLYFMNGSSAIGGGLINTIADLNWQIKGIADFNGDNKADILWRNTATGLNYIYFLDGAALIGHGEVNTVADLNWKISGVADFNGDSKADILWRNAATGLNYIYFLDGTALIDHGEINTVADLNWKISNVGDFNGDNKADILWRNASTGQNYLYFLDATTLIGHGEINTIADLNWKISSVGDFNGDNKADILWRHSISGQNYIYLLDGNSLLGHGEVNIVSDQNWKINKTSDYNGDGKADILWRNTSTGLNYLYLMDSNSIINHGSINTISDQNWKIQ